jgi:uncharacterized membrane protein
MTSPASIPLGFTWPFSLEYFSAWQALLIFCGLSVPFVLLGLRSLTGLGAVRKWVVLSLRLAVLGLIVLILGGLRWQRIHHDLEVMVLRDISESTTLVTGYPGQQNNDTLQTAVNKYLLEASQDKFKPAKDRIGVVGFHSDSLIDAMPQERLLLDAKAIRDVGAGTDIAGALQLGLASMSRDAMHRVVVITDGNPTTGDTEAAIRQAISQRVQLYVMPLRYDVTNEVMTERVVAPTWKRENEDFSVEVALRSTNAAETSGRLTVYHQNEPMDMDPFTAGLQASKVVALKPGLNVIRVPVPGQSGAGVHQFRAVFEGENVQASINGGQPGGAAVAGAVGPKQGDTLLQNNVATSFTFVRGKGKVLLIDNTREGAGKFLRDALGREGITVDTDRTTIDAFPTDLVTLQNYDAVILANVPRGTGGLNEAQERMLASYVHDMGGGLVMIGGPDSFGAGGWQGSKLEEVLPVNMDIPAQRQIAKGALVLVMHSCEMPNGNYWGEQCAIKAAETLSERDEIGVISYAWGGAGGGGSNWDFPLQEKGDGSKVVAAIKKMQLGDMPSFDDSMDVAINGKNGVGGLKKSDAKQKHVIVISDGDPGAPKQSIIDDYVKNKITVSTISVYPHGNTVPPTMQAIADQLKGKYYGPINGNFSQLPQIFIKEATIVRRSLIHENREGIPLKSYPSSSEMVKGIGAFPGVFGYILTSKKPNPQIEMPLVAGKNNDPVLAHWQTGLGRAAAFTSDAHNLWAAQWVGSEVYDKFWAQVVRAVSRAPQSTDFDIQTTQSGRRGRVVIEALDKGAAALNFLTVRGQVVGPDLKPVDIKAVQTGPGVYEAEFDTPLPGNYVVVMNYHGQQGPGGVLLSGVAMNTSPELRDLKSNDAMLQQMAERTGGRLLPPFDPAAADLFNRAGLVQTASPMPVWDILIPFLLALLLIDVAARRIAWDWNSTKRLVGAGAQRVREYTLTHRTPTESGKTLDSLKKVRTEVTEQQRTAAESGKPAGSAPTAPDPKRKFEAKQAVEGDITQVVGGATNQPTPGGARKPAQQQSGQAGGETTNSLFAAKRRAQQQIKQKEQEDQQ